MYVEISRSLPRGPKNIPQLLMMFQGLLLGMKSIYFKLI